MSSRKLSDAIVAARQILQDQAQPYRYDESDLKLYASEGVATIYRIRPDLMEKPWSVPNYDGADLDTELPEDVSTLYFTALVDFMAGRAELRDDQFATDGRAMALLGMMRSSLLRAGG